MPIRDNDISWTNTLRVLRSTCIGQTHFFREIIERFINLELVKVLFYEEICPLSKAQKEKSSHGKSKPFQSSQKIKHTRKPFLYNMIFDSIYLGQSLSRNLVRDEIDCEKFSCEKVGARDARNIQTVVKLFSQNFETFKVFFAQNDHFVSI